MALANTYVVVPARIPDVLNKIRDGQAPERFTQQLLKDWGFPTKNDRAFIPMLKAIGFLTADGKPTQRYNDYRDHSRSRQVLGQALRESYGDLFLINERPTESDKHAIQGKFKSFHNASDNVAGLMTKTFLGLLNLADISVTASLGREDVTKPLDTLDSQIASSPDTGVSGVGLHYNVQIHLPATKDVEVYNAIFKSLRIHLIGG